MESVILHSPFLLLIFGVALLCRLLDRNGRLTVVSAVLAILGCAASLFAGADVWECAVVLMVFLLLNMGVRE